MSLETNRPVFVEQVLVAQPVEQTAAVAQQPVESKIQTIENAPAALTTAQKAKELAKKVLFVLAVGAAIIISAATLGAALCIKPIREYALYPVCGFTTPAETIPAGQTIAELPQTQEQPAPVATQAPAEQPAPTETIPAPAQQQETVVVNTVAESELPQAAQEALEQAQTTLPPAKKVEEEAVVEEQPAVAAKSNKTLLIAGGVLAAVAVGAAIYYYALPLLGLGKAAGSVAQNVTAPVVNATVAAPKAPVLPEPPVCFETLKVKMPMTPASTVKTALEVADAQAKARFEKAMLDNMPSKPAPQQSSLPSGIFPANELVAPSYMAIARVKLAGAFDTAMMLRDQAIETFVSYRDRGVTCLKNKGVKYCGGRAIEIAVNGTRDAVNSLVTMHRNAMMSIGKK